MFRLLYLKSCLKLKYFIPLDRGKDLVTCNSKKEDIEVELIYTPPYSPNFNLAEYLIHQLRLQLLHHQPVGMTIELVREKLEKYLQLNQLQTPQQIQSTIAHICSLVK
jgi:uncharacterized protein (UPF0128 family)